MKMTVMMKMTMNETKILLNLSKRPSFLFFSTSFKNEIYIIFFFGQLYPLKCILSFIFPLENGTIQQHGFVYLNIAKKIYFGVFKHIRVRRISILIGWTADTLL